MMEHYEDFDGDLLYVDTIAPFGVWLDVRSSSDTGVLLKRKEVKAIRHQLKVWLELNKEDSQ